MDTVLMMARAPGIGIRQRTIASNVQAYSAPLLVYKVPCRGLFSMTKEKTNHKIAGLEPVIEKRFPLKKPINTAS
jgi:hypothetical protein